MANLQALAVTLMLLANFAGTSLAIQYYYKTEYFNTDASCGSQPVKVLYQKASGETSCNFHIKPCSESVSAGIASYTVGSCAIFEDGETPAAGPTYVGWVDWKFEYNCDAFETGLWYMYLDNGQCVPTGSTGSDKYHMYHTHGSTATYISGCLDSDCIDCSEPPKTVVLIDCPTSGGGANAFHLEHGADDKTAVYTTPYSFLAPYYLSSGVISETKDCYALVGGKLFGGWSIVRSAEPVRPCAGDARDGSDGFHCAIAKTSSNAGLGGRADTYHACAQICCVSRGEYDDSTAPADPVSYIGCDHRVNPIDFFYQSTSRLTYQHCYTDPVADHEVSVSFRQQQLAPTPMPSFSPSSVGTRDVPFLRNAAAVVPGGSAAGAFRHDKGSPFDPWPTWVYCLNEGVIDPSGTRCRMNNCGDTTDRFYYVNWPLVAGDPCYHTCFAES